MNKKFLSVFLILVLLVLSIQVVTAEEDITPDVSEIPEVSSEPEPTNTEEPTISEPPVETITPEPIVTDVVEPTVTPMDVTEVPEETPSSEPTEAVSTPVASVTASATNTPTPVVTKKPTPTVTKGPTHTPTGTPYATVVPPKEDDWFPAPNGTSDKSVTSKSPAVVKVDGIYDEVWDSIEFVDIKNVSWGESGATGKFKVYWDKQSLFILVDVEDFTPDTASDRFTRQDCVEIFINENGTKPEIYGEGDCHFKINSVGAIEYGNGANEEIVEYKVIPRASGYMIEISVEFTTISPVFGQAIGFDVRVNDSHGDQYRDYMIQWSDTSMYTYTDLSKIGTLYLK